MARRKKKNNINWIIAGLVVGVFAWIAVDFYLNIYRHPQEKVEVEIVKTEPEREKEQEDNNAGGAETSRLLQPQVRREN